MMYRRSRSAFMSETICFAPSTRGLNELRLAAIARILVLEGRRGVSVVVDALEARRGGSCGIEARSGSEGSSVTLVTCDSVASAAVQVCWAIWSTLSAIWRRTINNRLR